MWPFASRKKRPVTRTQPRRSSRVPQVEMLEDRCLLSIPGSLDPTFGNGGFVTTNFAKKSADFAQSVAVQTDGKIIAAGIDSTGGHFFEVARYDTNGTLDTSFGTGGKVLTKFDSSGTGYLGWGFVLQPDGKIVAGATPYGTGGYELVRYNTNGTLDTTFGPNHTGIVTTTFSGGSAQLADYEGLTLESVNGSTKIVAGVDWRNNTGGSHNAFALARYNLDGSLDNTFGVGGEVVAPAFPLGCFGVVHAVTAQADGKIVLGGRAQFQYSSPTQFIVARYDTSGNLDPTFGNGGLAALPNTGDPNALAIQSDGKIVAGGAFWATGGAVVRFNVGVAGQADGSLDTSFGAGGIANSSNAITDLVIQANGKIVAAEGGVARYNSDGTLDTGFGNAGAASMPASSMANAVALQADGKIVAAGQTAYNQQTSYDFAVARFLGDPVPPKIGSFTAIPTPATAGSNVPLTASNMVDNNPGGTITQVAFYLDSNGDGKLETGTDMLLGYGTQTSPGVWTLTFSTAGWTAGSFTLFGQAEDNYGVFSDALAVSLVLM
jgi:uncharacterized delta-60 repeat protein